MAKKQLSVKEKLRRAAQRPGGGRPTKTHTVFIGADLDLIQQYEQALGELEKLDESGDDKPARGRKLDEVPPRPAVEARIAALREELEEFAVEFRLRGLDDRAYERLEAAHPPRKGEGGEVAESDKPGFNKHTFPRALVRAATIAPALDDEDWQLLFGDDENEGQLTETQLDRLAGVAYRLSKVPVDVPFWHGGSPSRPNS